MQMNQVAINAISTAKGPLEELCRAYAAAGFERVEFPLPMLKQWMKEHGKKAADVKKLLEQHKLRCVGGFEAGVLAFSNDSAKVKENHDLTIANCQLLADLGGGILVIGSDAPEKKDVAGLKQLGQTLRGLAEKIPASVSLALEFNWSAIAKSLKGAYLAVEAANHPRVGIVFDPAHAYCTASKTEDLTPAVIGKIIHVHVDDMRDKPGDLSDCNGDRLLPGEGCLDLVGMFRRLEQAGYRGLFSIELFNADLWKLPTEDCAKRCYAAMQQLAKSI